MKKELCDLHTHSIFSDGSMTPTELIAEGERIGLAAMALTDHNTVSGLPEFLAAAEGKTIEAVPGVEFSTDYRGIDLHIVALGVRPETFPEVEALLAEGKKRKDESNARLCRALTQAGYPVDYQRIRAATPNGQVNRAHIAQVLVEQGVVPSVKAAMNTLLDGKKGYYDAPKWPDTRDILAFIHQIGAVSVMAHPFLKLDEKGLREFLKQAVTWGLVGMETHYSTFDEAQTRLAIEIAKEFGLRQSGGSDFHGTVKPDIHLGVGRGNLEVPLELLRQLQNPRDF